MLTPARFDLTIQRHAPWQPTTPFRLTDQATGAPPFDMTGATVEVAVRLYDDAAGAALILASTADSAPDSRVTIVDGPGCAFLPFFALADIQALPPGRVNHGDLSTSVRLRWDCRIALASGLSFYAWNGVLIVDGTVVR